MRSAIRSVLAAGVVVCWLAGGCAARQDPQMEGLKASQEELRVQMAELRTASDLLGERLGRELEELREQVRVLMEAVRQTLAVLEGGVRADAERLGKAAREAAISNLQELLRSSALLLERLNRELDALGRPAKAAP